MTTLRHLAGHIFRHANRRFGQPYIQAVRPVTAWSLPAGFSYDRDVDAVTNVTGTVLPNPESYWLTDTVYIVPSRFSVENFTAEFMTLTAGGQVAGGAIEMWIAQADIETLRAAHCVLLDKRIYNVESVQEAPSGYPDTSGLWARLRLMGRA